VDAAAAAGAAPQAASVLVLAPDSKKEKAS
jgi:hypothetical protein